LLKTRCFFSNGQDLENQIVAWGINSRLQNNGFMKKSNGYLGLGDFYSGRVEVIKGSAYVISRRLRFRWE
jgi:hypothetical protein